MFEERRERRQMEEFIEEVEEEEEEEWLMEGVMFDPYMHGELFFDPQLGHHGVMYNGRWHPVEYMNGSWAFAHPRRFGVPRRYQPQNLMPPQVQGYGGGYNQQAQGGYG